MLADALAALDRALIEASEAEDKIARAADALTFDPARLEQAEARLFEIRGLPASTAWSRMRWPSLRTGCAPSFQRSRRAESGSAALDPS